MYAVAPNGQDADLEVPDRAVVNGQTVVARAIAGHFQAARELLVASGIGLLAAGAISSRFTPRPWWYAGGRQLLFGAAAAGITYLVGSAIGVTV